MIEEVARVIGFDKLPTSMPMINAVNVSLDQHPREVKRSIRQTLLAAGIDEAISYSMTSHKNLARTNLSQLPTIAVTNPLSNEQEILRPHLFPTLFSPMVLNLNRGNRDVRFFEIGNVFSAGRETTMLAILMTGRRHADWRLPRKDLVEFSDIKGVVLEMAKKLKIDLQVKPAIADTFDQAASASIEYQGKVIGAVGAIDKKILAQWEIKGAQLIGAYLNLQPIMETTTATVKYQPLNEFPGITRDVSLAVKTDVQFAAIKELCLNHGSNLLKDISFVEQYVGDKIQAGFKGQVFSLFYQANNRTLREDEVQGVHQAIVDALKNNLGAIQR